jgi:hypothetical protein
MPGVASFQMRQVAPDRILVLVAPGPAFGHLPANEGQRAVGGAHDLGAFVKQDVAMQFLRQWLEEQVCGEAVLDMALVESIPLGPGGKHRFFVDERKETGFFGKDPVSGGASS